MYHFWKKWYFLSAISQPHTICTTCPLAGHIGRCEHALLFNGGHATAIACRATMVSIVSQYCCTSCTLQLYEQLDHAFRRAPPSPDRLVPQPLHSAFYVPCSIFFFGDIYCFYTKKINAGPCKYGDICLQMIE